MGLESILRHPIKGYFRTFVPTCTQFAQWPHFFALPILAHPALQSVLVRSEGAAWQDFGVRTGRKRATGDTTQLAVPLGRITTGWACQISIVPLFQTIAVRTKVPDHGELFSARRWSGKVGRLKSAVVGTSGSVRTTPPAIWFAAWAEPHRPVAPANPPHAKVILNDFSGVK